MLRKLALSAILGAAVVLSPAVQAQCPASVPVQGAAPPAPMFPADNWWNVDISSAPVDPASSSYIAFINNGGTRRLHPDFGGEAAPGSTDIYGLPYVVVDGAQPKVAVTFGYRDESDGVDRATGQGVPFYPIPPQAITQSHWIEGGAPGNVDERSESDRHLIVVDCANRHLYELFNVFYDTTRSRWYAGSGAFFDLDTNQRRPEGWTSADAAGLAIFPGLVRYDEAWNDALPEIAHAFRVTVRATNGYVFPASHRAGSTPGALPMGARLRLKASVNGADPALRTSDPHVRKIFRAMQKHGLIVADNGSDLFVTGTFDTRWNNDILNPAFRLLTASDFDVIQLGWKPAAAAAAALASITATPAEVVGGTAASGVVTLTAPAPAGGARVTLSSASGAISVPPSVTVAQNATTASFAIATSAVGTTTAATVTASYAGTTRSAIVTVKPAAAPAAALSALTLQPPYVKGGSRLIGTVALTAPAPAGGAVVTLASSNAALAATPPTVVVAAGATSGVFVITTAAVSGNVSVTLSASRAGVTKTAVLALRRR